MSAGKIRAGQAFVEITLQNHLEAGLRRASTQLRAFANTTAVVGAALVAAGTAVTAPLLAALPAWAEAGDAMLKMATRTGVGVRALSELKYAALMADLEMGSLEGGMRKLAVKLADATQGNHAAQKAFRDLGIDWQRLRQQSPDRQLETVADALVAIRNPADRAAAAVDMFGKTGTELLPVLAEGGAGLRKMREEADRLGLTMSEESARKAGVLADAFKLLHRISGSLLPAMAAAVAPDMTRWTQVSIGVVVGIRRWIKEHQDLIATVFRVGSVVGMAGTALLGLAGVLRLASLAAGTLGSFAAGSFNLVLGLARGLIAPFVLATGVIMNAGRSLASLGSRGAAALGGLGRLASGAVASIATALGNLAVSGARAMGALAVQAGRLGVAMWTGVSAGAARIAALWPQVSAQIAAGLASVPRVVQAVFATARGYADSFARGLTGNLGLGTTRAAYLFWQLGDAVRGGVDRAGQYFRALGPLVSGAAQATYRPFAPMVDAVVARLGTLSAAVQARLQAVGTRLSAWADQTRTTVATRFAQLSAALQGRLQAAGNQVSSWASQVRSAVAARFAELAAPVGAAAAAVQAKMQSAWSAVTATANSAVGRVVSAWQSLPPWVTGPLAQVASMARQDFGRLGAAAVGAFGVVRSAALSALPALRTATSAGLSSAWTLVRSAGVGAFRAIRVAGMSTLGLLGTGVGKLGSGFAAMPGKLKAAGGGLLGALGSLGGVVGGGAGALLGALPLVLSAVGALGTVLATIVSPIGLVTAAVVGGIYAWTQWSDTGKQVLATVTEALRPILDTAKRVFGGVAQALAGGDIKLAAQILWAGVKVIFYQGLDAIKAIWPMVASGADQAWTWIKDSAAGLMTWLAGLWAQLPTWITGPLGAVGETLGSVLGTAFSWIGEQFSQLTAWAGETFGGISNAIAAGDWGLAFEVAWASIKVVWMKGIGWITTTWSEATTGIAMLFDQAVTSIRQAWNAVITWIAQKLIQLWGVAQKTLTALGKWDPTGLTAKLAKSMKIDVQAVVTDLEQDKQRKNRGLEQGLQQRDDARGQALLAQQNAAEAELEQLRQQRREKLDQAQAAADAAGPVDRAANAAKAMAELNDALEKAKQIKPAFEIPNFDPEKFRDQQNQQADDLKGKFSTSGTFNATALWGFGGSDPTARIAAATEETAKGIRVLIQRGGRFVFTGPATPVTT
jgi:hypothetical protein